MGICLGSQESEEQEEMRDEGSTLLCIHSQKLEPQIILVTPGRFFKRYPIWLPPPSSVNNL